MNTLTERTLRKFAKSLVAIFVTVLIFSVNTSPANAFAGTLENGNLAYAAGSGFDKGEACNYLPGFETGYDAWHFVLTTRGATFQQDPKNPAIAINLNFVFMRQDSSLFVIKSGAWVQTGKGAYTYTPVADRIRMVQAGSLALINGSDSGMRLSHTCPGTGSITATPTASPTASASPTATASSSPRPTTSPSATPSPTSTSSPRPTTSSTPTSSASATPTTSSSPTPSASPSTSPSASASPTPSLSPTPSSTATPRPSSTVIPTLAPRPSARASAIQNRPTSQPNALPTPSPTPQGITETPSPSPSPTSTRTASPSPTPTTSGSTAPTPTTSPEPTSSPEPTPTPPALIPPVLPTPPLVEEPKNLVFVEPKTPTVVPPQSLPEPPASPIVITKAPEFGTVSVKPSGEITYTSTLTDPKSTTVDVVEITYTSLSGAVVVVRKEFILTQRGDVPSIIQTGYSNPGNTSLIYLGLLSILGVAIGFRMRGRRNEA